MLIAGSLCAQISAYWSAQAQAYLQAGSAGWFMWSLKMENGGIWSLEACYNGVRCRRPAMSPGPTCGPLLSSVLFEFASLQCPWCVLARSSIRWLRSSLPRTEMVCHALVVGLPGVHDAASSLGLFRLMSAFSFVDVRSAVEHPVHATATLLWPASAQCHHGHQRACR